MSIIQAAGARAFCLGVLAIILTLPCKWGVGATTFAISGFNKMDAYVVRDSIWILNSSVQCFYHGTGTSGISAGRFLYPGLVQMKDPGATTVKSFSTSFIYRFSSKFTSYSSPGMAFIIVPDNVTIGGSSGYMGVITADTPDTSKNYESDNYTFAVELDTQLNSMFDDVNDNHVGVNLASMNSSHSIKPNFILASISTDPYQQIWIEYSEATSTLDIYSGYYGQAKPNKPQGSQLLVNLSYLKESMYIGFTAATSGVFGTPTICAWSYSNDGIPPPPIYLGQEAPPIAQPPPPSVNEPPPPGLGPQAPSPSPAKAPPPASPVPPTPPPLAQSPSPRSIPPPLEISPPPVEISPPPMEISPPPVEISPPANPPSSSPSIAPQDPSSEHAAPPARGPRGKNQWIRFGIPTIVVGIVVIIIWWVGLRRPFRVFISNTGGEKGSKKIFPLELHQKLKNKWWFKVRFGLRVFIDKKDLQGGLPVSDEIFRELCRFDLGIVVVSDEFFRRKWPMTELIAFVEAQKKGGTRVLPLFFELTRDQVRHLKDETGEDSWEAAWEKMGHDKHPLEVEKCREAVEHLCNLKGVEYKFTNRDEIEEYLKSVIVEVAKILGKERSCTSGFWWFMPACIQRWRRTPVQSSAGSQIRLTNLQ